ncbi:MAG: hypothetical protein IT422_05945 [Pirellulaceae bacterium]|nr:hypothetical protein [Pirellulaceae bacterium]
MSTATVMERTFTRQEFYDLVWSAPATQLAKELGCSDVMIGKVCKAFDVPKPYSGYWAKLAHGKNPEKTKLPDNEDPGVQSLTFMKHPDYDASVNELPRELQYEEEILEILDRAKSLEELSVPKTLRNPHRLVAQKKEVLEYIAARESIPPYKRDYSSYKTPPATIDIDVTKNQTCRALRIMDAFIKRIEKLGGRVEIRAARWNERLTSTFVVVADEDVTQIRLREKHNQIRVKTDKSGFSWRDSRTELIPSGELLFDEGPSSYGSPLLKDTKKSKIEDGLGNLVITLIKKAGEMRLKRRVREELERRQVEEARRQQAREEDVRRRREELRKLQEAEQERVNDLLHYTTSWKRSREVRDYLDALCHSLVGPGCPVPIDGKLAEYLKWGFQQADRMDPLKDSPHSVLDDEIEDSVSRPNHPR